MGTQFGVPQPFFNTPQLGVGQAFFGGLQFGPPPVFLAAPQFFGPPKGLVVGYDGPTNNFGYNSFKTQEKLLGNGLPPEAMDVMITDFSNPSTNQYYDALGYAEGLIESHDLDRSGIYSLNEEIQFHEKGTKDAIERSLRELTNLSAFIHPNSPHKVALQNRIASLTAIQQSGVYLSVEDKQALSNDFSVRDRNKDGQIDRLEEAANTILSDSPDVIALIDAYGGDIRFVPPEIRARLDGVITADDAIGMAGLDFATKGRLLDRVLTSVDLREADRTYKPSSIQQQGPVASYPVGPQAFMQKMFSMMQQMMQMFQR